MHERCLYRGKRIDNGEWVYWDCFGKLTEPLLTDECMCSHIAEEYIDPETVGQYTGLKDRNGVKIFAGDIVNCSKGCPHEVIWLQEYGGTFLGGMPAWYLSGLRDGYAWTGHEEVINNIHDKENS